MYTITTSILASCLVLLLICMLGLVDASLLDRLVFWDLIFVPFLAVGAIGSLIGIFIAKLIGKAVPRIAEVTETIPLSFLRSEDLGEAYYCVTADTSSGKNAYHLYTIRDNNLRLVKSLWQNDSTSVVQDESLEDAGIWKKTTLVPDPASPLYRWALARPQSGHNELHLPPAMVQS